MTRPLSILLTTVACTLPLSLAAAPSYADHDEKRPDTYLLQGDPIVDGAGGSKFEGIGYDAKADRFYVSEVTGGEIHRGTTNRRGTTEWLAGDGTDGRYTARGITVDSRGRVYVAGGPNGINQPNRPDLWVYDRSGDLLAALRVDVPDAFLNDVAIGPDGAAYFTNSNAPQVFRVSDDGSGWSVDTWADASPTIQQEPGFNLGGIVYSRRADAFVVAQGNTGALWRFDARSATPTRIYTEATLRNADGLVLRGRRLTVVRNFDRVLTTLRLDRSATQAETVSEVQTDPDRVFTTAKLARGRLLLVDSKFDESVGAPPYEVVSRRLGSRGSR